MPAGEIVKRLRIGFRKGWVMVGKGSESVILYDSDSAAGAPPRRRETWFESNAFHRAILASASLSVVATDAGGTIRLFNTGAERMLGYSAREVVGTLSPVDILDPEELAVRAREISLELSTPIAADFGALTCKASLGGEDCYQSILIAKNRERIPVAVAITVVRDDMERIAGYSLILSAIVVRPLSVQPREAAPRPPAAGFSPSDLLTRMSHEMRTPLSAILGFAQLIDSGRPVPTYSQKKSIDRILQAGWYLEKLMGMTRDLALIESGNLSLSLESLPLQAVMLECQANLESLAQTRGVRVTFSLFETPCFVSADRNRLQDALGHLLCAAIECCEVQDSIVVDYETHGAEWVRIKLHGAGAGLERLMRSFLPVEVSEQKPAVADATGIGLVLAQRLIESMGGAIGMAVNDVTKKIFAFDLKRMLVPIDVGTSQSECDSTDDHPRQRDELLETICVAFNASETSAAKEMLRN